MRSSIPFGLSALALAISVPATAALTFRTQARETPANARPDLNAFVNRKINTTQSLVHQVKTDPEVADRYQRHFAMNQRELVTYLSRLHPGKLGKGGVYTVYSVPQGGRVKMHREALKKGAPIFADAAGHPTLIVKCGNPLVLGPSKSRKGNLLTVLPPEEDDTRQMALLSPRDADLEMPAELLAMMPLLPEEEILPPTGPTGGGFAPMPLVTSVPVTATGGSFPWFAGLPLLFPIFGAIHNGGGGGDVLLPVPEPATMAALAMGIVCVARKRRKA